MFMKGFVNTFIHMPQQTFLVCLQLKSECMWNKLPVICCYMSQDHVRGSIQGTNRSRITISLQIHSKPSMESPCMSHWSVWSVPAHKVLYHVEMRTSWQTTMWPVIDIWWKHSMNKKADIDQVILLSNNVRKGACGSPRSDIRYNFRRSLLTSTSPHESRNLRLYIKWAAGWSALDVDATPRMCLHLHRKHVRSLHAGL